MKQKIIYTVTFVVAFVVTTGAIYYLNLNYINIFKFDFTHRKKPESGVIATTTNTAGFNVNELKQFISTELTSSIIDSLKTLYSSNNKPDTNITNTKENILLDSLKEIQATLKQLQQKVYESQVENSKAEIKKDKVENSDSSYIKWTKKTASIYETMDSRKAAKIITTYSDNVARDILYSMKKKKAAEIMSELSPEIASRISRE